jgi:hypothetical protein
MNGWAQRLIELSPAGAGLSANVSITKTAFAGKPAPAVFCINPFLTPFDKSPCVLNPERFAGKPAPARLSTRVQ